MRTQDIKKSFINDMYNGNIGEYLKARRKDYYKVQFEFSCYIDSLCKDGIITENQYNTVTF